MAADKIEIYLLDVKAPKTDAKRFECTDVLTVGSDSACDIVLKEFGLSPLHGRFRFQNGVLTFTNLGLDDSCLIGSQKCGQGRRYVLEKGDKFICGPVKIIVRKEKVEVQKLEPVKVNNSKPTSPEEATDPSAPLGAYQEEEYEEVEVYVDENGNEVAAPKKLGFFARIKEKRQMKKEEKQRAKEAQKSSLGGMPRPGIKGPPKLSMKGKIQEPTASIISRFLGITFDLIFFFMVVKLGFPFLIEKLDLHIFNLIAPATDTLLPLLTQALLALEELPQLALIFKDIPEVKEVILDRKVLDHILAFFLYDITFNLILGVGLGSFLIGLKADGPFLLVRLLSPLRVLIGWITLPLLIFDAPILLKKASFKETISMTRIINRSLVLNFFSTFIFMPILIIALGNISILPLLLNLPSPIDHTEITLNQNKGSVNEVEFYLRSYGFKKEGKSFVNPKIEFIPTLPTNGIAKLSPLILFIPEKEQRVTIQPISELMDFNDIFTLLKKDPTFSIRHQELLNTYTPKEVNTVDEDTITEVIQPDQAQVIIELLYAVFAIDFLDPIHALEALGPFIAPYYELRNEVLKRLSINQPIRVIIVNSTQAKYLKIITSNDNDKETSTLITATSKGLEYYQIDANKRGSQITNKLLERIIIYPRELKKDYSKLLDELKKDEVSANNGLMAHAILTRAIEKVVLNTKEIEFFTKYFMTMAQKAIKTENQNFQTLLLQTMEVLDKALLRLKNRNKDEGLAKLRLGLLRIQKALFERDFKFFKANKR